MNKPLRFVIGLSIGVFFLWLVLRNFRLSDLRHALVNAQFVWFLPAMAMYLLNHLVRSVRWRILLLPLERFSPFFLFPILIIGFFLNCVLPARAGELARAVALSRWTPVRLTAAFGSIAAERLCDLFGVTSVVCVALFILPREKIPVVPILCMLVAGVTAVAVTLYVVAHHGETLMNKTTGFLNRLVHLALNVASGFLALKSVSKVLAICALSIVVWMNEALNIFLVSRVFHLDLSFLQAAALLVGVAVGYMIPGAPGAVGTMEFFGSQTLLLLGFQAAVVLPFIFILHTYQIGVNVLFGFPCFLKVGVATPEK